MPGFGTYAPTTDYTKVKNGSYAATISDAAVVMENGQPKLHPDSKKMSVKVEFQLDLESDDGPIELTRTFPLSFGKNRSTGAYSNWAVLVEAATGVPCGDPAQRHAGKAELVGKRVILRTKNVESGGNKYTNIVDFEPLEDEPPKPQPRPPVPPVDMNRALNDDEIPF